MKIDVRYEVHKNNAVSFILDDDYNFVKFNEENILWTLGFKICTATINLTTLTEEELFLLSTKTKYDVYLFKALQRIAFEKNNEYDGMRQYKITVEY